MIPLIQVAEHRPRWQQELAGAVRSLDTLLRILQLPLDSFASRPHATGFPLRVPHAFIRRMQAGNPRDPLLLQVLPLAQELVRTPGYHEDPLAELSAMPVPGLLHKYLGRALLTMTGACAVHCRYCFRRHFPYAEANPSAAHWQDAIDYLARNPDIGELILSGGDPLTLTDARLQTLSGRLQTDTGVHTLRIHSRLPVVLPSRIDSGLLAWLAGLKLNTVLVIHCNHPQEIDTEVATALTHLKETGITLLNQSVLLRHVNDDAGVLTNLARRLFDCGVLPYYLHQMDRVQGAAHFEVDDARALALVHELRATLPGYLVPRLVREQPGMPGKTAL